MGDGWGEGGDKQRDATLLLVGAMDRKVSKHSAQRPQKPYGLFGTGRRGGRGYGGGGEGDSYTYRYTVTIRMTSALRWAVMRAI